MNSGGPRDFWERDPNPVLRPSEGLRETGPPSPRSLREPYPAPGSYSADHRGAQGTYGGPPPAQGPCAGAHTAPPAPHTAQPAPGAANPPPGAPPPSGPPPRVGGAVAALVVAFLTWAVPLLGITMGLWFYVLVANLPGVAFAVTALTKIPNTSEVERFIRYTWACNFAYIALSVVFAVPLAVLFLMMMLVGG
ncbi:hypothetical protein GCM10007147_41150 [Nocardiopsis kunsanensis]|uniref:Uncharacterized protein n=1 Tax=Nocardiopsis kunsanensis TaxID=141693 RepID=A0A918XJB5_9ACTN|nr:hypothetical protein GCM10007147_41150 [Nocardiopsis kunsanensis]